LAKKVLGQVKEHLSDTTVPQDNIEEIIEVGDQLWYVCAKEDRTPMESEQMLFSTLLNIMEQDFGVTLEVTPTLMLMEEETVEELQQEELFWHLETECFKDELYALSDNAVPVFW
jgi:Flp pilus assembly secretin CpaC